MELKRADVKDAYTIWKLQIDAFAGLLANYQDYDTSPGADTIERIEARLKQTHTYFYYIMDND